MSYIKQLKNISSDISILYIEDEDIMRKSLVSYLKLIFTSVDSANDGEAGLKIFKKKRYDIVITDIQMPKMNGLDMIEEIRKIVPEQKIIITTAFSESNYLMRAISLDVSGYLMKPMDFNKINHTLFKIVSNIKIVKENEQYKLNLQKLVKEKTAKNLLLEEDIIENYEKTVLSLVELVEKRDTYTGGHSLRVAHYSKLIAQEMHYSRDECELLYRAGILHDIGKIETPDAVLLKPAKLDNLEFNIIKEHVTTGADLLSRIPMYRELSKIVAQHHERYDGKGYPLGYKGDEIIPFARIIIIADAFDAMTTNRIYKPRMSISNAMIELKRFSGTQFHPDVVKVAIKVLKNIKIDKNIFQLPSTAMENKKFAFFFEDQITKAYNQTYLDLIFIQNQNNKKEKYISMFYIHNFSTFNNKFGWEKGDIFLKSIVLKLQNFYKDNLIFRIHGDDFVVISDKNIQVDLSIFKQQLLDIDNIVTIECKQVTIKDKNIKSTAELDKYFNN